MQLREEFNVTIDIIGKNVYSWYLMSQKFELNTERGEKLIESDI